MNLATFSILTHVGREKTNPLSNWLTVYPTLFTPKRCLMKLRRSTIHHKPQNEIRSKRFGQRIVCWCRVQCMPCLNYATDYQVALKHRDQSVCKVTTQRQRQHGSQTVTNGIPSLINFDFYKQIASLTINQIKKLLSYPNDP